MNYNPYDLVPLLINGKPLSGRPLEFDSVVVDQKEMKNSFGSYVKPTRLSTVCPDCGAGLVVDVVLPEPPFKEVSITCEYCHAPPPPVDPFENPLDTGRVDMRDLDPLVTGGAGLPDDGLTVQERLALRKAASAISVPSGPLPAQKPPKKKKHKKKAKEASGEPIRPIHTPAAPLPSPAPIAEVILPAAEARSLVEPADDISGADDEDLQSILEQLGDDGS